MAGQTKERVIRINLTCQTCGARFARRPKYVSKQRRAGYPTVYCGISCAGKAKTEGTRITRPCLHCGREIWSYASQAGNVKTERKYCSRKCASAGKRRQLVCAGCLKPFTSIAATPRKYCSQRCAGTARTNIQRNCLNCSKEYRVLPRDLETSRFCNFACKVVYEGRQRRKTNSDEKYRCQRVMWREVRLKAIERDKGTCKSCGSIEDLVVHHIVRWRISKDDSLDNLTTLCRKCHLSVEYGSSIPVFLKEKFDAWRIG